jgi:hypothetical protein
MMALSSLQFRLCRPPSFSSALRSASPHIGHRIAPTGKLVLRAQTPACSSKLAKCSRAAALFALHPHDLFGEKGRLSAEQ